MDVFSTIVHSSRRLAAVGKWSGVLVLLLTAVGGDPRLYLLAAVAVAVLLLELIFAFRHQSVANPYWMMLLSPLLLLRYSSIPDFRIRLLAFLMVVYIVSWAVALKPSRCIFSLDRSHPFFIWLVAVALFSLVAVVITRRGVFLSGDEPHYVMIAQSLLDDGDIDLKNNLEQQTYRSFHPVELDFHGQVVRGRFLPFHLPGLSVLLVPFYWVFSRLHPPLPPPLFFRLAAAMINAFFALGLFQLLKALFPNRRVTGWWLFSISTFPLVFHGVHLYPELPAALLLLYAILWSSGQGRRWPLAALFLALIPWFHVKYLVAVLITALYLTLKWGREKKFARIVFFMAIVAAGLAMLLLYSRLLYGTLNPDAIFPPGDYFAVSWRTRLETMLAFFLDQRDGLLVYAPVSLFLFFGLRNRSRDSLLWPAVFFAYLGFHAFTTIRGAYSPAARPVMFVYWIAVVLIARYHFDRNGKANFWFRLAGGFTLFASFWLLAYPLFLYQPVTAATTERASALLSFFGSDSLPLSALFPSFLKTSEPWPAANYIWLAIGLVVLLVYYLRRQSLPGIRFPTAVAMAMTALLAFGLCFYPHVFLRADRRFVSRTVSFFNPSRNFVFIPDSATFRVKAGSHYDIFVDGRYPKKDTITLNLLNGDDVHLELWNKTSRLFRSSGVHAECFSISLAKLRKLRVKNKLVVPIGIDLESRAPVPNTFLFLRFE